MGRKHPKRTTRPCDRDERATSPPSSSRLRPLLQRRPDAHHAGEADACLANCRATGVSLGQGRCSASTRRIASSLRDCSLVHATQGPRPKLVLPANLARTPRAPTCFYARQTFVGRTLLALRNPAQGYRNHFQTADFSFWRSTGCPPAEGLHLRNLLLWRDGLHATLSNSRIVPESPNMHGAASYLTREDEYNVVPNLESTECLRSIQRRAYFLRLFCTLRAGQRNSYLP